MADTVVIKQQLSALHLTASQNMHAIHVLVLCIDHILQYGTQHEYDALMRTAHSLAQEGRHRYSYNGVKSETRATMKKDIDIDVSKVLARTMPITVHMEHVHNVPRMLAAMPDNVSRLSFAFRKDLGTRDILSGGHLARRLRQLQVLNLDVCQSISDDLFAAIDPPHLHTLSLFWLPQLTNAAIFNICRRKYAANLISMNLSGCVQLTDAAIMTMLQTASRLQTLDLTRLRKLTDQTLIALINAPDIRVLRLYACNNFSDVGIIKGVSNLQNLEVLDLTGSPLLTDAAIVALANCARLVDLRLTWCINLTDAIGKPLSMLHRLTYLSLHGLVRLTDSCIDQLSQGLKVLKTIDLNGCKQLSRRSLSSLQPLFPSLTEVASL